MIKKCKILKIIENELKKIYLTQNYRKVDSNFISSSAINFIGFSFEKGLITLKEEVVQKKERQLERLIFDFARLRDSGPLYKNDFYLCWKLNNSIAGFVSNSKIYSWVQTYKNVDDEKIFYHLDALVRKLLKRAKISRPSKLKSFSVTYNYLIHNNKSYLENFDKNYKNTNDKRAFLEKLIGLDKKCSDSTVIDIFNDLVKKTIYESERDLDFKYRSNF